MHIYNFTVVPETENKPIATYVRNVPYLPNTSHITSSHLSPALVVEKHGMT